MSRAPRRSRHAGRYGPTSARRGQPPAARAPQPLPAAEPGAGLRHLVQEGIITAAALNARDDLELAAASTHRLGALTSGMWRALSRELATAAERLDRSTMERLENIERRSRALEVDADEVVAAGATAMHLAEHRDTLLTLIPPADDARRLLDADMLFGFSIDAVDADAAADDSEADDFVALRVTMFLWPAPLTPATITFVPPISGDADESNPALQLGLSAPRLLLDALAKTSGLSGDRLTQALSSLAVACWTAHHLDELDEEETDDDVGEDDGPVEPDLD